MDGRLLCAGQGGPAGRGSAVVGTGRQGRHGCVRDHLPGACPVGSKRRCWCGCGACSPALHKPCWLYGTVKRCAMDPAGPVGSQCSHSHLSWRPGRGRRGRAGGGRRRRSPAAGRTFESTRPPCPPPAGAAAAPRLWPCCAPAAACLQPRWGGAEVCWVLWGPRPCSCCCHAAACLLMRVCTLLHIRRGKVI